MKKLTIILFTLCSVLVFSSCEKFLDKAPENLLLDEDNYTDKANVYASFAGLYSTVQSCMDQLILVTTMRGDLAYPTGNAGDEIWAVYDYEQDQTNEFVNPAPYYRVVMNANDFLRSIVNYYNEYPGAIPYSHYRQMVAAGITVRTWAYLTIGKLYGEAVYYDYSMTGQIDLASLPVMDFDRLIDELIYFMDTGVERMNAFVPINVPNILFGTNDNVWKRASIDPDVLMMELYLWDGQYESAAKKGVNLLAGKANLEPGNTNVNWFTMAQYTASASSQTGWMNMFNPGHGNIANEGITIVKYDYTNKQTHRLQEYFSALGANKYLLRYSVKMADMLTNENDLIVTNEETGITTFYNDYRVNAFTTEAGRRPVIRKYHYMQSSYEWDSNIYIYRAAEVFLMLAEALSALGGNSTDITGAIKNFDAADALLNEGMKAYYVSGTQYNAPFDAPIYAHTKFSTSNGVRGRVGTSPLKSTDERFLPSDRYDPTTTAYINRRKFVMDSLIAAETARELAYEGKRFFTLMRMARATDNPDFLALQIAEKYAIGTLNGVMVYDQEKYDKSYAYMSNPENWFIKYDFGK